MAEPDLRPIYTPGPAKPPRGTKAPKTRMAARLVPIPRVYNPEIDKVKKIVKKPKKPVQLHGRAQVDDQFNLTVTFSPAYGDDAGRTYGASLNITPGALSPEGNKDFYVRCLITQHRVDPLLQGFKTFWEAPPGWTLIDGKGTTLYDEAISNPLYITRVYHSPPEPNADVGFRVTIKTKYKP